MKAVRGRAPSGWQFKGHDCTVNVLVVEGRMVLSPVFVGAQPDEIDDAPHAASPTCSPTASRPG